MGSSSSSSSSLEQISGAKGKGKEKEKEKEKAGQPVGTARQQPVPARVVIPADREIQVFDAPKTTRDLSECMRLPFAFSPPPKT